MLRGIAIAAGLLMALAVVASGHWYMAKRLILEPGFGEPWRMVALVVVIVGFVAMVLAPIAERVLPRRYSRLIVWPSALWMGFAFMALMALWSSELLVFMLGATSPEWVSDPSGVAKWRALVVGGGVGVVSIVALLEGLRTPRVRHIEVELENLPPEFHGYHIVQISDIHIGALLGAEFARTITGIVASLDPDLVAVTGDLVDGTVRHLAAEVEPFGELSSRDGIFFVTGNHDHYSGAHAWATHVGSLGMRVLRNEHIEIRRGEAAFVLAGVDDHRGSSMPGALDGGEDLDAALANRNEGLPVVLLAHDPSTFKCASRHPVDLQISGHTHGGQIFPFSMFVRLAIPFVAGHYEKNGSKLYVSRGTGFWGPPMRLGAPAEVTSIRLLSPNLPWQQAG